MARVISATRLLALLIVFTCFMTVLKIRHRQSLQIEVSPGDEDEVTMEQLAPIEDESLEGKSQYVPADEAERATVNEEENKQSQDEKEDEEEIPVMEGERSDLNEDEEEQPQVIEVNPFRAGYYHTNGIVDEEGIPEVPDEYRPEDDIKPSEVLPELGEGLFEIGGSKMHTRPEDVKLIMGPPETKKTESTQIQTANKVTEAGKEATPTIQAETKTTDTNQVPANETTEPKEPVVVKSPTPLPISHTPIPVPAQTPPTKELSQPKVQEPVEPAPVVKKPDQVPVKPVVEEKKPEEKIEQPQQNIEQPQQKIEQPQQKIEQPQQMIEQPQQQIEQPQQRIEQPQQQIEQPQQRIEQPQQQIEQPQQKIEQPQQQIEQPQQKIEQPQQKIEQPQQKIEHPQQQIEQPQNVMVQEQPPQVTGSPISQPEPVVTPSQQQALPSSQQPVEELKPVEKPADMPPSSQEPQTQPIEPTTRIQTLQPPSSETEQKNEEKEKLESQPEQKASTETASEHQTKEQETGVQSLKEEAKVSSEETKQKPSSETEGTPAGVPGVEVVNPDEERQKTEWDRMQEQRVSKISGYCAGSHIPGDASYVQTMSGATDAWSGNYLVDDINQVIACIVPKTATTYLKLVLANITGDITIDEHDNHARLQIPHRWDFLRRGNILPLNENDLDSIEFKARRYRKFMFTRDPVERFIGSYREKLEDIIRLPGVAELVLRHAGKFTPDISSNTLMDVSFPDFTKWFLEFGHTTDSWGHYYLGCVPCFMKYNYIGHVEDMDRDLYHIIDRLYGKDAAEASKRTAPYIKEASKKRMEDIHDSAMFYLQQLEPEVREQLYDAYSVDRSLFDYEDDYEKLKEEKLY